MLGWFVVFLTLAAVAAVFGFGAVDQAGISAAETLFWFFLGLAAMALIVGWPRSRPYRRQ